MSHDTTHHHAAPLTEHRSKPRTPPLRACQANRCHQGRCACPVPQACELPEEAPGTPAELVGLVTWLAGIAAVILFVLIASASA